MTQFYPVQIWTGFNYTGYSVKLLYSQYSNITSLGLPTPAVSSLKVGPYTSVELYNSEGAKGTNIKIVGPMEVPNLSVYPGGSSFEVKSIRVFTYKIGAYNKMNCCQGSADPLLCGEYEPGSARCDGAVADYCDSGRITLQSCKDWCNTNPIECLPVKTDWCKGIPEDPYCDSVDDGSISHRVGTLIRNNMVILLVFMFVWILIMVLVSGYRFTHASSYL
jgi:hypothetical protein